jgi:protein O-GlcNAc transferase
MPDLLVEKKLNKARSLFTKGKETEASNLLNSIIKQFPQNKKVQHIFQQLPKSSVQQSYPTKEQINTLLKYYRNGQLSEAENLAKFLIKEFPTDLSGWKVLGLILGNTGRKNEALRVHQKALEIAPQDKGVYNNLGNTLKSLGRFEEAELSFKQSMELNPTSAITHNNLGVLLKDTGRLDEAKMSFLEAIRLNPEFAEAHNNLGLTLGDLHKYEDAELSYNRAIKLNPYFAEAYNNLGLFYYSRSISPKHLYCFENAISINPNNIFYRWNFANLQLFKVYLDDKDYNNSLKKFEDELIKLNNFITSEKLDQVFEVIGTCFPYYLAYFENNNKNLLEKHGEICCRVMKKWQEKNLPSFINSDIESKNKKKINIGIISSHIRYHSVWNHFLKGIVNNLNTDKFDLHIFSLNDKFDDETKIIKKRVKYFYSNLKNLNEWAIKIKDSRIDIAIYPEIGMDKLTIQLASMRLAPIQLCSFGHPETSGLRTIDYYISSELLETTESQSFYSEKLIQLPGLGYYFEPPTLKAPEINLTEIGIDPNLPLILCLGAPNKFSPLYDWVYIEIIKRIKACQIILNNDREGNSEILKKRLKNKLEKAGLNFAEHFTFISPGLTREGYSGLMYNADLLLDPIGFSGANTTLQAIGCGLPVVTREGRFQRTKHASAILRTLGIEELITYTEDEYISLVEKLILNERLRKDLKYKIKSNENYIYKNIEPIRALENFLESVGGK